MKKHSLLSLFLVITTLSTTPSFATGQQQTHPNQQEPSHLNINTEALKSAHRAYRQYGFISSFGGELAEILALTSPNAQAKKILYGLATLSSVAEVAACGGDAITMINNKAQGPGARIVYACLAGFHGYIESKDAQQTYACALHADALHQEIKTVFKHNTKRLKRIRKTRLVNWAICLTTYIFLHVITKLEVPVSTLMPLSYLIGGFISQHFINMLDTEPGLEKALLQRVLKKAQPEPQPHTSELHNEKPEPSPDHVITFSDDDDEDL